MPEEERDEAQFKGFGTDTKLKGTNLIMVVLIAAIGLLMIGFQYRDHQRIEALIADQVTTTRESIREQQVSNWLLSLPPDKRPELNMPWHLWERLKHKEDFRGR